MKSVIVPLLISCLVIIMLSGCFLILDISLLAGTQWRLSSWSDSSIDPSQFTITANFSDSAISGISAINSYSGSYTATANQNFSVDDLQMTLMGGSGEAMNIESIYFQLIREACQYNVNKDTLILFNAFGKQLLVFSRIVPINPKKYI